jgi:hypothetical protein
MMICGSFSISVLAQNQIDKKVLVWLVVNSGEAHYDVASDLSENKYMISITKMLHEKAKLAGISIILPSWDLQDMSVISSENFEQVEKLSLASKRYGAKAQLLIKMKGDQTIPCVSHWSFLKSQQEKATSWTEDATTCDVGIQDGMKKVLEMMDPTKAPEITSELPKAITIIHLQVSNILSVQDYQQVFEYLQKQPNVTDVRIEKVEPSRVFYALSTKENVKRFMNNMKTNTTSFQLENADESQLEYRFVKESTP